MIDAIDTPTAASITADHMARIVRDFRADIADGYITGYEAWVDAKVKLMVHVTAPEEADEILAETLASMAR